MDNYSSASNSTPLLAVVDLRLKVWPILAAVGLAVFPILLSGATASLGTNFIGPKKAAENPWLVLYMGHTGLLIGALVCIALLGKGKFEKFGLRFPSSRTYAGVALAWGAVAGIAMTMVDYLPNLAHHIPPADLELSVRNIAGWLSFEGLFAGTVEEILFRGLLVTFLAATLSGRVRFWRYDVSIAGVIVAVLFCLAHLGSFWTRPLWMATGQQAYAFGLAILYTYFYEKSDSLLAPIIAHNAGNVIEYALAFVMVALWR
jgi:membrane protease YdiL (CAAX protease family)